ncbi:MAG: 50S ribosomal protein L23 [Candidatus Sungbacteria bacterium]|nr:50S ribosomal protein L23 [Candidatus Sungbacteria bacterium]
MLNPFKKDDRATPKARKPAAKEASGKSAKAVTKIADRRHALGFGFVPHLTEKAMAGGARRWYAFRVPAGINKIAAKKAVEERYGVGVEKIRVAAPRAKSVRLGRISGRAPGFKKVWIKVKEGQSIELA